MRRRAHHNGKFETLIDFIEAQRLVWVFCLRCGHSTREHPYKLAQGGRDGGLAKLDDAAKRCRCRRCNSKAAMLIPSLEYYEGR